MRKRLFGKEWILRREASIFAHFGVECLFQMFSRLVDVVKWGFVSLFPLQVVKRSLGRRHMGERVGVGDEEC